MLAGTSIRQSSLLARAHSTKHALPFRSQRQLSSFAASKASFSSRLSRPVSQNGSGLLTSSLSMRTVRSPLSARFLSSTPVLSVAQPVENNAADSTAAAPPVSESVPEVPVPNLADIDLSQVMEEMGFLKTLGLDYGWGPSSMVQTALEFCHVYGGLTWVGSVIALSVAFRFAILKLNINASDATAKMQRIKPLIQGKRDQMMAATRDGDRVKSMQVNQEIKAMYKRYGVKTMDMVYPMIQVPIGFGFFRVLRGMGNLPVPSLENESFLWLSSVTAHDPLFILPLLTGGTIYLALKRGMSVGLPNEMMKYMIYILPVLSGGAGLFFPGILQLYFATTSTLMVFQTYAVTWPKFRDWVGIEQFPVPSVPAEPRVRVIQTQAESTPAPEIHSPQKVSLIDRAMDNAKNKYNTTSKELRDKMERMAGQKTDGVAPRLSKAEIEKANAYEKRRAEQIAAEREMRNNLQKSEHLRKKEQDL